ncbi:MAG: GHKL domain-containing protein [Lachnospiraceae bacterium]|jgi:signal transduction histidine kinase|nr:GHKL domain-containing protein [Lachnospiraceae bacterium]
MFDFIRSYSVVLIEAVCCIIFFETFGERNRTGKGIFVSRWKTVLCLSVFSFPAAAFIRGHVWLKLMFHFALTLVVMSFYMKEEVKKCLLLSIILQGLLWLSDFITLVLYPSLVLPDAMKSEKEEFLVVLLAKMFLLLLIMVVNIVFRHRDTSYIRARDWGVFLLIPVFTMAVTIAFIRNMQLILMTRLERFFVEMALGFVCLNIIMFYFMQNVARREYLLHEKELLDVETKNQTKLYKTIMEKVQDQRKLSHEYKNQITCIQALCETGEYDKLKEYLGQISGEVLHDLDYIDTNHVFVNAVLNAKYQEAAERDILFVCKINDLSGVTMNSSDLVVLLSNLLNNAIEACEKCEVALAQESSMQNEQKMNPRKIKIKCVCEEDELILSVRNTQNGTLKKERERLYTTKRENSESHGIGLKNVIQIINKNDGYYALGHTENEFQISIVIPQGAHR